MRFSPTYTIPVIAGCAAAIAGFGFSLLGQSAEADEVSNSQVETAIFAGGCFWCVESDFDKVEGVIETVSGYTGGKVENPTYKQVTYKETGHLEAVRVTYDPSEVTYGELVTYFFRHIDPTDDKGQFCDKGSSYRTAVFVASLEERAEVNAEIAEIEATADLGAPVVTRVLDESVFYPAEDYHQDYYKKNPVKYNYYRTACGRDKRVQALWGGAES